MKQFKSLFLLFYIFSLPLVASEESLQGRSKEIGFMAKSPFDSFRLTLTKEGEGFISFSKRSTEEMSEEQRAANQAAVIRLHRFLAANKDKFHSSTIFPRTQGLYDEGFHASNIQIHFWKKPSLDFFLKILYAIFNVQTEGSRDLMKKHYTLDFAEVFGLELGSWSQLKLWWNEVNKDDPEIDAWGFCPLL